MSSGRICELHGYEVARLYFWGTLPRCRNHHHRSRAQAEELVLAGVCEWVAIDDKRIGIAPVRWRRPAIVGSGIQWVDHSIYPAVKGRAPLRGRSGERTRPGRSLSLIEGAAAGVASSFAVISCL